LFYLTLNTATALQCASQLSNSGQKVLLSVRNMGGESEAAWRGVLDDLLSRGLRTPQFLIIDGAAGLERALAALWPAVPTQRSTVHYAELRIMPTSVAKPAWEDAIAVKDAA